MSQMVLRQGTGARRRGREGLQPARELVAQVADPPAVEPGGVFGGEGGVIVRGAQRGERVLIRTQYTCGPDTDDRIPVKPVPEQRREPGFIAQRTQHLHGTHTVRQGGAGHGFLSGQGWPSP